MTISVLTGTLSTSLQWTAQKDVTGTDYSPVTQGSRISKSVSFGTSATPVSNEIISYVFTIAGGGSSTLDLTSLTDVLLQTSISLARVRGYVVRLLSTTDDATNGTAAASLTVGNAAATQNNLNLNTNSTFYVLNGGIQSYCDASSNGFVAVSGSAKSLKIVNNDGSVTAAVQVSLIGRTS